MKQGQPVQRRSEVDREIVRGARRQALDLLSVVGAIPLRGAHGQWPGRTSEASDALAMEPEGAV